MNLFRQIYIEVFTKNKNKNLKKTHLNEVILSCICVRSGEGMIWWQIPYPSLNSLDTSPPTISTIHSIPKLSDIFQLLQCFNLFIFASDFSSPTVSELRTLSLPPQNLTISSYTFTHGVTVKNRNSPFLLFASTEIPHSQTHSRVTLTLLLVPCKSTSSSKLNFCFQRSVSTFQLYVLSPRLFILAVFCVICYVLLLG